jgi:hypothetical protein
MRPLKLKTNLRYKAVRYRRIMVAALTVAAVLMVAAAGLLWQAAGQVRSEAGDLREMNGRATEAIAVLEDEREALGIDDQLGQWLLASVSALHLPAGRSPAAVLYELERIVPAGVFLTSYSHDTEGQVEILVATTNRRDLGDLIERLHGSSVFRDVQVVNRKESMPGRFEAQVRLKGN